MSYYFIKYKWREKPKGEWTEDCMLIAIHPLTWFRRVVLDERKSNFFAQTVLEFYQEVSRGIYYKNRDKISVFDDIDGINEPKELFGKKKIEWE
jgi:hypothetical protein